MRAAKRYLGSRRKKAGPPSASSPVSNYSFELGLAPTLNGVPSDLASYTPVVKYVGDGLGGFTTVYGTALAAVGTGTSPTNAIHTPFLNDGEYATTVYGDNQVGYRTATSPTHIGDVNCAIYHFVYRPHRLDGGGLFGIGAYNTPGSFTMWQKGTNDGDFDFYISGATSGYLGVDGNNLVRHDEWADVWVFLDRRRNATTGSMAVYVNGTLASERNGTTIVGALDGGAQYNIGAYPTATQNARGSIALLEIYAGETLGMPGDADNSSYFGGIAREGVSLLSGAAPSTSLGVAAPRFVDGNESSTVVRDDALGNRRLLRTAEAWPRVGRFLHDGSLINGIACERSTRSQIEQTVFLEDGLYWDHEEVTSCDPGEKITPTKGLACELISTSQEGSHYIYQTGDDDIGVHTFGAIVAAANKSEFKLAMFQGSEKAYAYFNLTTGAVGTTGGTGYLSSYMIPLGETDGLDWFECVLHYTSPAAAHEHRIQPCAASETDSFSGNGSIVDLYVSHVQHEENAGPRLSSPIITARNSAITRGLDVVEWYSSGNIPSGQFTISFSFIAMYVTGRSRALWYITETSNEFISCQITEDGYAMVGRYESGALEDNITGSTDLVDGEVHNVSVTFSADRATIVSLIVDGATIGTNVSIEAFTEASFSLGSPSLNFGPESDTIITSFRIEAS